MAIFKMIEENEASGKVKEVFDDIKSPSSGHTFDDQRTISLRK